jgi:hypothetical protein
MAAALIRVHHFGNGLGPTAPASGARLPAGFHSDAAHNSSQCCIATGIFPHATHAGDSDRSSDRHRLHLALLATEGRFRE